MKVNSHHAGGETGEAQFSTASKDLTTINFWGSNIHIFAMQDRDAAVSLS